jgi:hypothetical protein
MEKKLYAIFEVSFGIIFSLGILGNMLNIIVFSKKKMKKITTYYIFLYLSQIDLFLLMIILADKIELKLYSETSCKTIMFLTNYLTQLSSIVLTMISIERTIVIYKKNLIFFRLKSIKKLIVFITVIFAILNLHYLFFFHLSQGYHVEIDKFEQSDNIELRNLLDHFKFDEQLEKKEMAHFDLRYQGNSSNKTIEKQQIKYISYNVCYPVYSLNYIYFLNHVWIWIHNLIYSFIPLLIMLVSSILIITKINKSTLRGPLSTNWVQIRRQENNRKNQIFYTLVSTNIFFILCTLPFSITNNNFFNTSQNYYHISELLTYAKASFNFVFYFIFSTKYKLIVYDMIKKLICLKKYETNMVGENNIEIIQLNHNKTRDLKELCNEEVRIPRQIISKCQKTELTNYSSNFKFTENVDHVIVEV